MPRRVRPIAVAIVALAALFAASIGMASAAQTQVQRGKYLVSIIPCTDCHTPGTFLGKPDFKRYLGGSDVGFEVPGLGVFYGPNLNSGRPNRTWQMDQRTNRNCNHDGETTGWPHPCSTDAGQIFKHLTHADALAIAAYLKSLPAIKNKVPGPFGTSEKPTSFVYQVLPPNKYVPTPPPPSAPGK